MPQDIAAWADLAGAAAMVIIVGIAARADAQERSISHAALGRMALGAGAFLCAKWAVLGILPTGAEIALMVLTGAALCAMLLGRAFVARGDVTVVMITVVLVPAVDGIPAVVVALAVGFAASVVFHASRTLVPNMLELARTGRVFAGIEDSGARKAAAFFLVHRRRPGERFCFAAEESGGGRRRLVLLPGDMDGADIEARTEYVSSAIPFMVPYFIGSCAAAGLAVLGLAG